MKFLSICSGIEAASEAWRGIMSPVLLSEIEAFPRAVLAARHGAADARRYVSSHAVPLWGDFTALRVRHFRHFGWQLPEVLIGGTPCQEFSIAGPRGGIVSDRGNLALSYVRLAHALAATGHLRFAIWENVCGVLSMPDNAFGCLLGGLSGADAPLRSPLERGRWPSAGMVAGPRARVAWRVLDAQHFGLAQRRERVFVVAGFGDGADPAAVLFERKSSGRHSATRGKAREGVAGTLSARTSGGGGLGTDFELGGGLQVTHTLRGEGFDASEDGTGRGTPLVPCAYGGNNTGGPIDVETCLNAKGGAGRMDFESETFITAFSCKDHGADAGEVAPTLRAMGHSGSHANAGGQVAIAYRTTGNDGAYATGDAIGALGTGTDPNAHVLAGGVGVRRLTPRECERLQGFPDDYTAIMYRGKPAADGPRYKAIGNSFPVPVIRWIGERIVVQLSSNGADVIAA